MALPDVSDVHVNVPLTQISMGYQPKGFFSTKVWPLVPVDKQTDIYASYPKSYWARDLGGPGAAPTGSGQAVRRAPGMRARTVDYKVDTSSTYRCTNYALGFEIPDELRANADAVFNLDRDATTLLTALLNLRFDREFAADMITSGVWDNTMTISNKWSDYAAGTPIEDIRAAQNTLRRSTLGMSTDGGTKLLMGALVYQRLADHPDIIDRIKYGSSQDRPAQVTENLLAQLFEVDQVIVCRSVFTADEENGTAEASVTYTDVVTDDVLLFWTPPAAQQLAPSAGYLFNWRSLAGGGLTYTRKGREERDRYEWVEVHAYLDWVATTSGSGVYNGDSVD